MGFDSLLASARVAAGRVYNVSDGAVGEPERNGRIITGAVGDLCRLGANHRDGFGNQKPRQINEMTRLAQ